MEARPIWPVIWLLLLSTGCQTTPDPSVQLLEGEVRWMEDQLYMLEDQLQVACAKLNNCQARAKNQPCNCDQDDSSLRRRPTPARNSINDDHDVPSDRDITSDDDDDDEIEDIVITPPEDDSDTDDLPRKVTPGVPPVDADIDDDDLTPPSVDLPGLENGAAGLPQLPPPGLQPPRSLPPINDVNDANRPELDPNISNEFPLQPQAYLKSAAKIDKRVTHVRLTTRRIRRTGEPELVRVVIEPCNVRGTFVASAAPVTVTVLKSESGGSDPIPVVAWEFDVVETNQQLRQTSDGTGIHLDLPWPKDTPLTSDLLVQVDYSPIDGPIIQAHRKLAPKSLDPAAASQAAPLPTPSDTNQVSIWTPAHRKDRGEAAESVVTASHVDAPNDDEQQTADDGARTKIKTRAIDSSWKHELSHAIPTTRAPLDPPSWGPDR